MIHIRHNDPPYSLERRYKNGEPDNPQSSWDRFSGKGDLQRSLKLLQKGLCAYCESALDGELGFHLEHIDPKSQCPEKTFLYQNIVLSCIGGDTQQNFSGEKGRSDLSCGHNKKDNRLPITPTDDDCEQYFDVDLLGRVVPNAILGAEAQQKALETIELLNLNCSRLQRSRSEILDEGYKIMSELESDTAALNYFIDLELSEINGKYSPFISMRKAHYSQYQGD